MWLQLQCNINIFFCLTGIEAHDVDSLLDQFLEYEQEQKKGKYKTKMYLEIQCICMYSESLKHKFDARNI